MTRFGRLNFSRRFYVRLKDRFTSVSRLTTIAVHIHPCYPPPRLRS